MPETKTVTVFVGSGRKQRGTTYLAARRLLDELAGLGDVQGEVVFLSEHELGLCRGCKLCFERGEQSCPLGGDRDALIERIERSDGVIMATPNYAFQVSAITKAFLDRLGYLFHRPRFHGRAFTSIVVQGVYGGGKIERYLSFAGQGLGFDVVKGSVITTFEPLTDEARRAMDAALVKQARRFHRQLLRPADAPPTLFQLMAFRMARTSIGRLLGPESRDWTYYRDQGWFEAGYYRNVPLGPARRLVGWLLDRVFALVYRPPSSARPTG